MFNRGKKAMQLSNDNFSIISFHKRYCVRFEKLKKKTFFSFLAKFKRSLPAGLREEQKKTSTTSKE